MNIELQKNKVALITGSSRGIGRSIVEKLVTQGINVFGIHCSNDEESAREVSNVVISSGGEAILLKCDFSEEVEERTDLLVNDFMGKIAALGLDKVDILVNCAGIAPQATIYETSHDLYRKVFSINVETPLFLTKAIIPHMKEGGRIINISTALTRVSAPERILYAMSKGAINTFTLALAKELGAKKITVNAVAPGVIDTDMNSGWLNEGNAREFAGDLSVFSRVGTGYDVASVVNFLASKDASWITGQVIDVSGGSCI